MSSEDLTQSRQRNAVGPIPVASSRPRLAADGLRYAIATGVATAVAAAYAVIVRILDQTEPNPLVYVASTYFVAWSAYSFVYSGLTWGTLRRAHGEQLNTWLTEDRQGRQRRRRTEWLIGSGGPSGAIFFCAVAIGSVVWASLLPELRRDPTVVVMTVLVVVSSWLLIVIVYAVHYARENAHDGGLEFSNPDEPGPSPFSDFVYLAVQIGTSYNGADTKTTRYTMRRTMTVHATIAFLYNTVLIALLVSLLITATS